MKNFILGILAFLALSASSANALNVIGIKADGNYDIFPISETVKIKPVLTKSSNPTFNIITGTNTSTGYEKIHFREVGSLNAADQKMASPQQIAVYPNPVQRMIYLTGVDEDSDVEIVNMGGVVVKRQKGTEIDVTELASGIYVLKVASSQVKFIKQ